MNDGKLELRVRKCIFIGYVDRVKGYRLWCVDAKPCKCIISRDVAFNECAMLEPKNEKSLDAGKDHDVSKQVELEVEATENLQKDLQDVVPFRHDAEEEQDSNATLQ